MTEKLYLNFIEIKFYFANIVSKYSKEKIYERNLNSIYYIISFLKFKITIS
jgi:hypothetical protein